jgi:hypothetical protein
VARRLLYVAFFLEVGLLLIVLPWSAFWDGNYFVHAWPPLRVVLGDYFVRGGVSGLGVLNVFAGLAELSLVFSARARRSMRLGNPGAADSRQ